MSQNPAMGKDPLDWVGKGPNGVSQNGNGGNRPSGASGKPDSLPDAEPPYAESQVAAALSASTDSASLTQLELTRSGGPAAAPLEREILLMHGLPRERLPLARQSSRATVWFMATLVAVVLGLGTFFFLDSRERWSDHVQTLEGQIRATNWSLRQSAERSDELVRSKESIIRGKDEAIRNRERLLREKERLIEALQKNQRGRLDFAPTLAKIREIGQRMGRAFRLVPAAGLADKVRRDVRKVEVNSPSPFKPVPAIPGSLERRQGVERR